MKIFLATDHRGFQLKEDLKQFLSTEGYAVEDMGAHEEDPHDDYPDFVIPAARAVAEDPAKRRGIVLGYSGQGEAMAANRIPGVRAAVFYGGAREIVTLSREHNDANVLSLGAGFIDSDTAKAVVKEWLDTPFSDEARHTRRIEKLDV